MMYFPMTGLHLLIAERLYPELAHYPVRIHACSSNYPRLHGSRSWWSFSPAFSYFEYFAKTIPKLTAGRCCLRIYPARRETRAVWDCRALEASYS